MATAGEFPQILTRLTLYYKVMARGIRGTGALETSGAHARWRRRASAVPGRVGRLHVRHHLLHKTAPEPERRAVGGTGGPVADVGRSRGPGATVCPCRSR